jgi:hypothetical protein
VVSSFHDIPDAADLVVAVREFLERDVMTSSEGRIAFHARVAVNVLGMVERELRVGATQAVPHADGLDRLGFGSEAELAAAIRDGGVPDGELDSVAAFIRETVRAKLEVANPRYLEGPRPPA